MFKRLKALTICTHLALSTTNANSQEVELTRNDNPKSPYTQRIVRIPWKLENHQAFAVVAGLENKDLKKEKKDGSYCKAGERMIMDSTNSNQLIVDFPFGENKHCYRIHGATKLQSKQVSEARKQAKLYFKGEGFSGQRLFESRMLGSIYAADFFQSIESICKDNKQISPFVNCYEKTLKVKSNKCEEALGHIYDTTNHPNNQQLRDAFILSAKHLCQAKSGKDINRSGKKANYLFFQTKL